MAGETVRVRVTVNQDELFALFSDRQRLPLTTAGAMRSNGHGKDRQNPGYERLVITFTIQVVPLFGISLGVVCISRREVV